jgi:UPF0755 protein
VIILIVNVSRTAFEFTYQLYGPRTVDEAPGREIYFQIKKGESTMDIANKLDLQNAIVNKYSFYVKTKLQNETIMPGTYIIDSSMTYDEILAIITDYSASIIQDEPIMEEDSEDGTQSQTDQNQQTESETNP